jgi:hypothetical protein
LTGTPLNADVGDTVPQGVDGQLAVQLTPALAGSKFTEALNCSAAPTWAVAAGGATETVIASTVRIPMAAFVASATEVAVSVTLRSLTGGAAGAVYVAAAPLPVALGETEPHGGTGHDTTQVTPLLAESFTTVAVTSLVSPACKVTVVAENDTLIGGGAEEPPPQPEFIKPIPTRINVAVRGSRVIGIMEPLAIRPDAHPQSTLLQTHFASVFRFPFPFWRV